MSKVSNFFSVQLVSRVSVFLALFLIANTMQAEQLISSASDEALYEILNLRTITSQQIINQEKDRKPGEMYYEYLENWKEIIDLMAFEDEERYDQYQTSFDARIDRIKNRADKSNPAYHILLGEIYAHAGMANVMYGDFLAGFGKILKANKNAKKNIEAHPDYWLNNKLNGILRVSFDKIPSVLRWFTNLFGLVGDADEGYRRLNQYLNDVEQYPGLKSEALLYYGFALKLSKQDDVACELLNVEMDKDHSPVLILFLHANVMYISGQNEEALASLSAFPRDLPEIPFHHIDYMTGKAKQNRLDEDADVLMLKFLDGSNFGNYKKEICMRLAYHYYMQGNVEKYTFYKDKIPTYSKSTTDRDREAEVENQRPYDPHPELLKVRFLNNGSYFSRANEIIKEIRPEELGSRPFLAEYYLQLAKIKMGATEYGDAIDHCDKAIKIGKELDEPYAAEAALIAGIAAERQGNTDGAESYWKLALKFNGKDVYFENINKKAKNMLKKASTVKGSNQSQLSSS